MPRLQPVSRPIEVLLERPYIAALWADMAVRAAEPKPPKWLRVWAQTAPVDAPA